MACYTEPEIAKVVKVDQSTVSRDLEDLCNLEALPKNIKLSALFQDDWKIGERIGCSQDKVSLYSKLIDNITTHLLDIVITYQQGRVGENTTDVVFNFTEGWFRDSIARYCVLFDNIVTDVLDLAKHNQDGRVTNDCDKCHNFTDLQQSIGANVLNLAISRQSDRATDNGANAPTFNFSLLVDKIDTNILSLAQKHQDGRVSANDTVVSFTFTEGWFRNSGKQSSGENPTENLPEGEANPTLSTVDKGGVNKG